MIPLRLHLKNFLPYRSPDPILFDGIHLACLTGHNGAGKSSLLDAITWALWGKSRAATRRDDELIHQGQVDMSVQLDFEQEAIIYRVYRRRSRGKRTQGSLDLFVIQDDGALVTINEPSMKQTQQKINDILRLDYDIFTHSAFLQQGKADAFTTQKPGERKRILSEILSLSQWQVYEDRVKVKLKDIEKRLGAISLRLDEIDEELAKEPQYRRDMETAEADYESAKAALEIAQTELDKVAHAPGELKMAHEQKAAQERRLRENQRELDAVKEEITRHQERITAYEGIINTKEEIEAGYATLQAAREAQSELAEKLRQMSSLDEQYHQLEKQLQAAQNELETERSGFQGRITELERVLNADTQTEMESVQEQIIALEDLDNQREQSQDSVSQLKEERSGLQSTLKALEAEGKNINERLDKLEETDEANCPLCGQPLDEAHRNEIIDQLTTERDEKRDIYREHQGRIHEIEAETLTLNSTIKEWAITLKELPALQQQAGALREQLEKAVDAQSRLDSEYAGLAEVERVLAQDDFAQDVRSQITALQSEREAIGYDASSHDAASDQLNEYSSYEKQQMELNVALESLPGIQTSLENANARQERVKIAIEKEKTDIEVTDKNIEALVLLVKEQQARESEVAMQRTRSQNAYEKQVNAQQQFHALTTLKDRKDDLEERQKAAQIDEAIYEELRLAFGKNGVPAMIIETAIPELEAEANQLLARMTDGRMHLRMTTQKEKVTGGMMETLDIEIADELGTRNYDLYSGGEAFRINFAIRVALSKMLARRAGAHLRTLFIDEGFGTQDDDGRNKLVEAITAIQNDFDMILVITHIDELRDSFPVHVVVEKTTSGSMVSLR